LIKYVTFEDKSQYKRRDFDHSPASMYHKLYPHEVVQAPTIKGQTLLSPISSQRSQYSKEPSSPAKKRKLGS